MEALAHFVPLFVAVIAFSAFFTILGFVIRLFLKPLEVDVKQLQTGQAEMKADIEIIKRAVLKS